MFDETTHQVIETIFDLGIVAAVAIMIVGMVVRVAVSTWREVKDYLFYPPDTAPQDTPGHQE